MHGFARSALVVVALLAVEGKDNPIYEVDYRDALGEIRELQFFHADAADPAKAVHTKCTQQASSRFAAHCAGLVEPLFKAAVALLQREGELARAPDLSMSPLARCLDRNWEQKLE